MLNSFLVAFTMYSKVPMPKPDWDKAKMGYVMAFLPLIGIVVGVLEALWGLLCFAAGLPLLLRCAGLALIPLAVTGGIHLDGFLDTADALASHAPREKKLEILKDSHVGAFAVIACCMYIVAYFAVFSGITFKGIFVISVSFVFSRGIAGLSVVTFKNARSDGLLATFSTGAEKGITRAVLVIFIVLSGAAMVFIDWKAGCCGIIMAALTFLYYRYKSYKEFGGITGDLAGWFMTLVELMTGVGVLIGCLI